MPLMLDRMVDVVARRCAVAAEPTSLTTVGTESGDPATADRLWSLVEAVYRTGMHPGIQVCIRHRGEVVLHRAVGHARRNLPGRDASEAVPMRLDTPVNLFSAAKAVTAMAMHKLEEQGALSLDDRVATHLPGFERHGKGTITLRQVLSHRAGIPALPPHAFDLDLLADQERLEAVLCDLEPVGEPGGPPAYHAVSGGFILEAVTRHAVGRSLRDILAEDIKTPLGLGWLDYGVSPERTGEVAQNVETGFPLGWPIAAVMRRTLGQPWGKVLRMSNDPRFLSGVIPSGNVIVTAFDIAAFYQCLLEGGVLDGIRVFDEATVARAIDPGGGAVGFDRTLAMPMRYSSGFMLGSETVSLFGWNHPRIFGHVGMSNLFTWADPDRDLVVALLTTGKPVIGTHLVALVQLISAIHETFPPAGRRAGASSR